jgi:group I intron endonuclease
MKLCKEPYGYVYIITNMLDEKMYIGQTVNVKSRWSSHLLSARNGVETLLYRAVRKHGKDNFSFEVVEEAYSREELDELEIYYIELYNTFKGRGYNMSVGGTGHPKGEDHPFYGGTHTEDARKRIGDAHRGKLVSDETRKKLSELKIGKVSGEKNPNAVLSEKQVLEIIDLINSKKYIQQEIADMYGVKQLVISRIKTGRTWKHLHHLVKV